MPEQTGVIRRFPPGSEYGFIEVASGRDVFFSDYDLEGTAIEGSRVRFKIITDHRGRAKAKNIRPVEG